MTNATPTAPQLPPANNSAEGDVDKLVQQRFFPDGKMKGIMVDVGAARPDYLSVSAFFRTLGWRVIGIEPNPEFYAMHQSRGYEIYQYACGDHDEDNVNFNVVDSHGAQYENGAVSYESFSSLGLKDSYAKLSGDLDTKPIKVKLRRLSTLLGTEIPNVPRVDILSIDVEGWELEVLNGLDLAKHRPAIIIAENLFKEKKYEAHLQKMGYSLWRRIHPNDVYVDEGFIRSTGSSFRFALERWAYKLGLKGK